MNIKIKIITPLIALLYLVVSASSMLCASASVYFVNKHAKPYYAAGSTAQGQQKLVWIINRHIYNTSKVSISTHVPINNIALTLYSQYFVLKTAKPANLYYTEFYFVIKGRAPPVS